MARPSQKIVASITLWFVKNVPHLGVSVKEFALFIGWCKQAQVVNLCQRLKHIQSCDKVVVLCQQNNNGTVRQKLKMKTHIFRPRTQVLTKKVHRQSEHAAINRGNLWMGIYIPVVQCVSTLSSRVQEKMTQFKRGRDFLQQTGKRMQTADFL